MIDQPELFDTPAPPRADAGRDPLDRYYTPAWCTLALLDHLGQRLAGTIWEPAAGQLHIADVLRGAGHTVIATDITPYERLDAVGDFLGPVTYEADWIVTNPPYTCRYGTATDFVARALSLQVSVAMLLRLSWLEPCADRWEIFRDSPPTDYIILPRADFIGAPAANNQTSCWYIWDRAARGTTVRHYPSEIRTKETL